MVMKLKEKNAYNLIYVKHQIILLWYMKTIFISVNINKILKIVLNIKMYKDLNNTFIKKIITVLNNAHIIGIIITKK